MIVKRIVRRMSGMCEPAWYIFKRSLQLCAVMLSCGLLLTLGDPGHVDSYTLSRMASAFFETSEGVLLLGGLLPVIIEDQQRRR